MAQHFNPKIASILGTDEQDLNDIAGQKRPEEEEEEGYTKYRPEPSIETLKPIYNPDLPDTTVEELTENQVNEQLDILYDETMDVYETMKNEYLTVEPRARARHVEVMNSLASTALQTLKTKLALQKEKKDMVYKKTTFRKPTEDVAASEGGIGLLITREELLNQMSKLTKEESEVEMEEDDK